MPAYRYQITEHDRWAIIAYVRALQRTTSATIADVPADMRGRSCRVTRNLIDSWNTDRKTG